MIGGGDLPRRSRTCGRPSPCWTGRSTARPRRSGRPQSGPCCGGDGQGEGPPARGGAGWQFGLPLADGRRGGGRGIVAEANLDLLTRGLPSPTSLHRFLLLEHHVISEDLGQSDLGAERGQEGHPRAESDYQRTPGGSGGTVMSMHDGRRLACRLSLGRRGDNAAAADRKRLAGLSFGFSVGGQQPSCFRGMFSA
jgi:hypothetical protein